MKILISAETVRQAKASGQTCLPAGKKVLITPEARGVAEQLGIRLDAESNTLETPPAATGGQEIAAIRASILAHLPADAAAKPELVEQIINKVCNAQKTPQADAPAPASPSASPASCGIKLVKGADVRLGDFPGAGAGKQVGIADVITSADGAPIAAGFMAWSDCFFPWTLDYDEIDLVLEGELHIRCNGQTHVGKAGDVMFIPKGSAIEFGTTSKVRFFYVTYPANWQG
ncbi:MAG: ethanolamine utilization acetate kinase EutQ [Betaproteobacteria bacterium]